MKLVARRAFAFLAWSPLLLMVAGCANQAEGERCDQKNGNVDCDPGLICKASYVSGVYHYICCPLPPAPVSVAACNASGVPPSDSGVIIGPDARVDSGAEASAPDAPRDAVSEATEDRSMIDMRVDTRPDISSDLGADMSTPDIQPEAAPGDALDAPDDSPSTSDRAPDTTDDGAVDAVDASSIDSPADVAGEASIDAPLDIVTPIDAPDAADAPALDGPG